MEKAEIYVAYEESIKKGWFRNKLDHLAYLLQMLESDGHLRPGEREELLALARTLEPGNRDRQALDASSLVE